MLCILLVLVSFCSSLGERPELSYGSWTAPQATTSAASLRRDLFPASASTQGQQQQLQQQVQQHSYGQCGTDGMVGFSSCLQHFDVLNQYEQFVSQQQQEQGSVDANNNSKGGGFM